MGQYSYIETIDQMMSQNKTFLVIDYADLAQQSDLEEIFHKEPDLMLEVFARAIKETLQTRYPDYAESIKDEINVRIINYPLKKTVRQINSKSSGKFISIKAMLIRMSPVESIPTVAVYVCPDGHPTKLTAKRNFNIGIPIVCNNPNCKHRDFELYQKGSTFEDYQILQLQELPSELPPGKLPKTLGVFVHGSLVDSARMGDTVEITGIVRAELSNIIKLGKPVQTYRHRLYANNIVRLSNDNDLGGKIDDRNIQMINSIKNISEDDATELIVNSFATHIQGHKLIKEALILTMIGSDAQILDDGTRVRGDINIFLVGDPGTAKSEMGKAVFRVAPKAFYASGRGSTGAGLTAATIQDKTTGAYMLEPGITVLADEGLAIIDEFDKMKPEDRSALHEVMEQQTVSIAKGGITATLNARASIIAIANPSFGRYDPFKNLTENIPSIPIPLLTRFDMIFVVRDIPEKSKDEKIARHMISTHKTTKTVRIKKSFDHEIFVKYLRFAKQKKIKLSKEAEEKIIQYYLKMRSSTDEDSGYTITPRQLEGLVRLTTARAKFLLKDMADENDADRAIHIMDEMFHSSGVDVNTGKVDLGVLQGKPKSQVSQMNLFQDLMKSLEQDSHSGVPDKEIISEMEKTGKWDEPQAKDFFKKMLRESILFEIRPGRYSWVSQ
ncbi:MAG: minichromosome maintenance protein MCM [Nitrosopumilus sp.]|nr:minichromosome maintenance protein MCM [Nitrosopumilus sp.]